MRKTVGKVRAGGRCIASFFGALLRHEDRIESTTPDGYAVLDGWNAAPEETLVRASEQRRARPKAPPRFALFCYEGPHRGEAVLLHRSVETMGSEVKHSVVVTPSGTEAPSSFQFFLGGGLRCLSAVGTTFRVNGAEQREADLYDFDRVDLLGNRFLVLDLSLASAMPKEGLA